MIGSTAAAFGAGGCPANWVSMRVSQAVRNWATGAWANQGMALVADESSTAGYKEFASAEVPGSEPYLSVNWREPLLGRLGHYSLITSELTDRTRLSVNPANGNLLVEAADLRLPGDAGLDVGLGRAYNSREDLARPG